MAVALAGAAGGAEPETLGGKAVALDGDTLFLEVAPGRRERVRLFGIAAPEMADLPCGALARLTLDRVSYEYQVTCRVLERDRHKRPVGQCTAAGGSEPMGLWLLRQGAATAHRLYTYGPEAPPEAGLLYDRAEREAQEKGLGLWGQWRC